MMQNPAERKALLTALVEQVLPALDGISGVTAGVPEYLERLLTSRHGANYCALIDWGLQRIQAEHQSRYAAAFSAAKVQQRITLLKELAASGNNHYQSFWRTFIHLCLEGFLAHPRHGGNRHGQGWKVLGYAGSIDSDVSLSLIRPD